MNRHKLEILQALRDGVKPEDVPSGAAGYVRDFWDDMALLIKAGHVDRTLVHDPSPLRVVLGGRRSPRSPAAFGSKPATRG